MSLAGGVSVVPCSGQLIGEGGLHGRVEGFNRKFFRIHGEIIGIGHDGVSGDLADLPQLVSEVIHRAVAKKDA